MERPAPAGPPGHPHQEESSACCRLTVRVLGARNLRRADLLSEADPYVTIQLPTAPGTKFKTKTITDCSHPVWDEAFSFLIQTHVKNVLELTVYDEDSVTEDDVCLHFLYDLSEVLPGRLLRKTFSQVPEGQEELDVEFLMETTSDHPESLITNGVLVARELSCLDVRLQSSGGAAVGADQGKLQLELELKGSYEDTQTSALGTASALRFHHLAAQETELSAHLKSSKRSVWNSDNSAGNVTVPLSFLAREKEVTVAIPTTNGSGVNMQLKAESCPKELAVHLGFDLCAEEQAFLSRRKQVVAKALKRVLQLDRDLQEDEVPVVGIAATGGGARAMTSLYGHVLALQKLGLLDCVTYFSGTSGSTWTMAHLYANSEWSQSDLEGPIRHTREHLAKSKLKTFSLELLAKYRRELEQRTEQGQSSTFVDLWALMLEHMLHGQVVDQKLSDQRAALAQGQNPLPLYSSLNVKDNKQETLDFKEWVEFSPYEVGFLKYGAFVPPELFGSEFFMGRLMKRRPESRICFLEGIWSNIYSLNLLDVWYNITSSGEAWKQHIKAKIRKLGRERVASSGASSWLGASWLQPSSALAQALRGFLTDRPLHHQGSNFLRGLQMHRDYLSQKHFSTWADSSLDCTPSQLTPQEPLLCLVDASYFINTSCLSLFRPGRKLDLILSFDYCLDSPFEALEQTEQYCRAQGLPFPRVEPSPQERQNPRPCHLFLDPTCPDAPVVLHFPLVNAAQEASSLATGGAHSSAELPAGQVNLTGVGSPYALFNMTYKEEDFDRLLQLSEHNVRSSQASLLQVLRMVLERQTRAPLVQT
ncbi:cytosolic phospholipase A2 delta [Sorex araneus]|uniref:cytosolic phospholipase A2 delta n=1 Tax=Sorex araneus TaxID=42254 RepID=UPI002433EC27|nr:cytosolic phospholipase A2 delta [Sorex araneus]